MNAMTLVTWLKGMKDERDEYNLARGDAAIPIWAHELVKMRPALFMDYVLNEYRDRLQASWTQEEVEEIEAEHRDLVKA